MAPNDKAAKQAKQAEEDKKIVKAGRDAKVKIRQDVTAAWAKKQNQERNR
jgi:hypothetical protein